MINRPAELMTSAEIIEGYHSYARDASKAVSLCIDTEEKLTRMLEQLRTESDWRHVRAYFSTIECFADRINKEQTDILLGYLLDMLSHPNGTVRRMSARTAGRLLLTYPGPTAMIWKNFLHRMLFPGSSYTLQQRRWIGYAMKFVLAALAEGSDETSRRSHLHIYAEYFKSTRWDSLTCLFLIDAVRDLPWNLWTPLQRNMIFAFIRRFLVTGSREIQAVSLDLLRNWLLDGWTPTEQILVYLADTETSASGQDERIPYAILYMSREIRNLTREKIRQTPSLSLIASQLTDESTKSNEISGPSSIADLTGIAEGAAINSMIVEDQRSETPWILKQLNLRILRKIVADEDTTDERKVYAYATHLLDILQYSRTIAVRLEAGKQLVSLMSLLSEDARYEFTNELVRTIESDEDSVSSFLPQFIGQMYLALDSGNQQEILKQLREISDSRDVHVVQTTLETAGEILKGLDYFEPDDAGYAAMQELDVTHISGALTGMLMRGMASYRHHIAQEALWVIGHSLYHASELHDPAKSMLYSRLARKMLSYISTLPFGDSVLYNASSMQYIDTFLKEHYRQTPLDSRDNSRKIAFFPGSFDPFSLGHKAVAAQIADMGFRVFVVLDESVWFKRPQPYTVRRKIITMSVADVGNVYLYPEEPAWNPSDPDKLAELFPGHDLYLVHGNKQNGRITISPLHAATEDVQVLRLPSVYEQMSSTPIREALIHGKDITGLVDSQVRNFIQDRGLYLGQPLYRRVAETRAFETSMRPSEQPDVSRLELCDEKQGHQPVAEVLFTESDGLLEILSIEGSQSDFGNSRLTALNETLYLAQKKGLTKAICRNAEYQDLLELQGFRKTCPEDPDSVYAVDMSQPLTMFFDTPAFIHTPFQDDPDIKKELWTAHLQLQRAASDLYPGNLLLGFESDLLNDKLIRKIQEHAAPLVMDTSDSLHADSASLAVPFGKLLKGVQIPGVTTKELSTEKIFSPDVSEFQIQAFPYDPSLHAQIHTLAAFRKPVILVDDLYHKGYRMAKITPLLADAGLADSHLLVGVMSGRGKALAEREGRKVDSVYYVPNMRAWLLESDLCPFIGGDSIQIRRTDNHYRAALPSINQILPYQMPAFLKGADFQAFYKLSETTLENTQKLYRLLESKYQNIFHRRLTLARISEVMTEPRYPADAAGTASADVTVSELLTQELGRLKRLRHLVDRRS